MQRQVSAALLFGAAVCFAPSADAQQVNAGAGENKDAGILPQPITTNGIPALFAHDGGRIFNTAGQPVTVRTTNNAGALANGGIINLDGGGTINVTNTTAGGLQALYANGGGSTITATSANVITTGDRARGAWAFQGGQITLNGGSIQTSGANSPGLIAAAVGGVTSHITSSADISTMGAGS